MMTKEQFITAMIDVPWVEGKSGFRECDCWGVVAMYHYHVLGICLEDTHQMDIEAGMAAQLDTGDWTEFSEPHGEGVVFMAYRDGHPAHCGVIIGDRVLHSAGGRNHDGYCRFDRLEVLRRTYKDMRYFIHVEASH